MKLRLVIAKPQSNAIAQDHQTWKKKQKIENQINTK